MIRLGKPALPPARVIRAVASVRNALSATARRMVPASASVLEVMIGSWVAQATYVATRLGVAEVLIDGARPVAEIAEHVDADPDALHRLLRALATHGIFTETRPGVFGLTPLADTLREDSPDTVRSLVLMFGDPTHWEHWSHLLYSVQTGKPSLEMLRGMTAFEFLGANPDFSAVFNRAMTDVSRISVPHTVAAYDFSRFTTIADIGGGHGALLAGILRAAPTAKGILFDLDSVVAGASELLVEEGVGDRVAINGGSFFEAVPGGADAYVLKSIIHDWDDDAATRILRTVRDAMGNDATLLLVETVLPEGNTPHFGKWLDLEMLVQATGRERTEQQFRDLLGAAGFELSRVVPTVAPTSIIEAAPA
ncbi:hydroxyneurosporene methyltransferase [Hoyosella sp. G463]|uniref:Hydroxyneurosporene methyltransferase n=1 Tax=Lolliginicoccus lacisalsi TaxID=2742202 RepID=A0A927J9X3_9ACTN|nr:methyltransferase [Lolliginicoccus lacisalsi]MBD8505020.1 hydroxyneurosporene methyltransferase [Lolliginicoccus lacisalsi]